MTERNPNPTAGDDRCPCRRCPRNRRGVSDLEAFLRAPGFSGSVVDGPIDTVMAALPQLANVVGVTAAGPVITNDVGTHHPPETIDGPLRSVGDGLVLRINPAALGTVLVTDPSASAPPTVRVFDTEGNSVHVTYLIEGSDRLAFESLSLSRSADVDILDDLALQRQQAQPTAAPEPTPEFADDQIGLIDSILVDGGVARGAALAATARSGFSRVSARRVIDALSYASTIALPMTTATAAPGCLQIHHDALTGAREHHGSMVIASDAARTMINFNSVAQCWVTTVDGAWGPTSAIEVYDRHGRCSFVASQTGPVNRWIYDAWEQLIADLVD